MLPVRISRPISAVAKTSDSGPGTAHSMSMLRIRQCTFSDSALKRASSYSSREKLRISGSALMLSHMRRPKRLFSATTLLPALAARRVARWIIAALTPRKSSAIAVSGTEIDSSRSRKTAQVQTQMTRR